MKTIPSYMTFRKALARGFVERMEDREYLNWVKRLPCVGCEAPADDPHHLYSSGFKGTGKQFMVDPCRDCTPKYRDAMAAAGRCQHPETVFILSSRFAGDRIGVPLQDEKKAAAWESAIMGLSGPVVGLPAPEVIDQAVTRISAKRKIGRPKKGEQR